MRNAGLCSVCYDCELHCQILALLTTYFLLVVQFVNPASGSTSSDLPTNYTVTTATYDWQPNHCSTETRL